MNRNILSILSCAAICLHPGAAFPQSIPPACKVAIEAYKACIQNTLEFLEVTDPAKAVEIRKSYDPAAINRQVREDVAKVGEAQAAQNCASKESRQEQFRNVSNLATPLMFAGALKPACAKAQQQLGQILQLMN